MSGHAGRSEWCQSTKSLRDSPVRGRPNRERSYLRRELLSLNQLCQRNCCCLRAEPCEIAPAAGQLPLSYPMRQCSLPSPSIAASVGLPNLRTMLPVTSLCLQTDYFLWVPLYSGQHLLEQG